MSSIYFYSANAKRNWAHLEGKNSRPGAQITTLFQLS